MEDLCSKWLNICKLRQAGETYENIGYKYGVSRQRIHKIVQKHMKNYLLYEQICSSDKQYYSAQDIANILEVQVEQVKRLMRHCKFPSVRIGGKYIIHKDRLDEFIKNPPNFPYDYAPQKCKIRCLRDGKEFKTMSDASKYYDIPISSVYVSINENRAILNKKTNIKYQFIKVYELEETAC